MHTFIVTCFLSTSLAVHVSVKVSHNLMRKAGVGMYYTYVLIILTILLFVCFLALPSLLHFSIKQLFFYTCNNIMVKLYCICITIFIILNDIKHRQGVTVNSRYIYIGYK